MLFSSCGSTDVSYETKHGFAVYLGDQVGPSKEDLESAIDMALAAIVANGVYTQKQVDTAMKKYGDSTIVRVKPIENNMGFKCGASSPTGYCWGRFWHNDRVIEITHQACVAQTAMVHEMAHWAHYLIAGIVDSKHEDIRMFVSACRQVDDEYRRSCVVNSVERLANVAVCLDRCEGECLLEE